jgi:8-amino-7-oxononanoate synthase
VSERYAPWRERLDAVRDANRWRVLRRLVPTGPTTAELDGREVIVACSNDYLGLARHPEVMAAARGGGSGGSRLISGSHDVHHRLEEALEDWLGRPCLLFNSGWNANLAVGSTLCTEGQRVGSDALNHASLIDGLRLGRAERIVLPHADPEAIPDDLDLVVVEGLFSMDGDRPPLDRYPERPWLLVDEAHAIGCIGPAGRGVAAAQGVEPDVLVGTFGKAFGSAGAFVCGPPELKALLVNEARSFIFTTALPEPVAHMVLAALPLADDGRRQELAANVLRLRTGLAQAGLGVRGQDHIVPVVVGSGATSLAERLLERGVYAPAIRWPTVPVGQERIRLTVSAAHTAEQIDRIVEVLGALAPGARTLE